MDNAMVLTAFAFFGHLEEYPNLRLALAHGGASWIPLAVEKAETYLTLASTIQDVSLDLSGVLRNRPFLATFDAWESSIGALYDEFEGFAAWGSRYPSHDTTTPREAIELLKRHGAPEGAIQRLMGGNAEKFFGGA